MSYEKYFIDVSGYEKIDIYRYLELLPGERGHAIEHALKKLALCGVRTGGKSLEKDITEARDTLNRWLEMREEDKRIAQDKIKQSGDQNKEWPSDERIDTIGQNGNEGEHYNNYRPWLANAIDEVVGGMNSNDKIMPSNKMRDLSNAIKGFVSDAKANDPLLYAAMTGKPIRKEYRDLEKPETWKLGDLVTVEYDGCTLTGEFELLYESGSGVDLICIRLKGGPKILYSLSSVTSVKARS